MEKYFFLVAIAFFVHFVYDEIKCRYMDKHFLIKSIENNFQFLVISIIWLLIFFMSISRYYHSNNNITLYLPIMQALLVLMYLMKSFQKDIINDYGICTTKGNYKWKKVSIYEWQELDEYNKNKDTTEYYNLIFYIKISKLNKYLTRRTYKVVSIKIDKDSKIKVQQYLDDNRNIINNL